MTPRQWRSLRLMRGNYAHRVYCGTQTGTQTNQGASRVYPVPLLATGRTGRKIAPLFCPPQLMAAQEPGYMSNSDLYDTDFYHWTQEQAARLSGRYEHVGRATLLDGGGAALD